MSFRRNPSAQSPRSNANRRQSADVFTPINSLTNRRQSTDVINPTNSITNRRQSADVINPTNRLTNRRQSADTSSLTSSWRSVDSIGLYHSALSRKTPEEDHPKTVQIVQVCAVNKEHLDNL